MKKEKELQIKKANQIRSIYCKLRLSASEAVHFISLLSASNSPFLFPKGEIMIFNDRNSEQYKFIVGNGFIFPVGSERAMRDASGEEVTLDQFIELYNNC
ncbi:MAG: hypothetical protein ACPGSG_10175 [Prolixibacteraceae bacterium]